MNNVRSHLHARHLAAARGPRYRRVSSVNFHIGNIVSLFLLFLLFSVIYFHL